MTGSKKPGVWVSSLPAYDSFRTSFHRQEWFLKADIDEVFNLPERMLEKNA